MKKLVEWSIMLEVRGIIHWYTDTQYDIDELGVKLYGQRPIFYKTK